jgi:hypothetical protein
MSRDFGQSARWTHDVRYGVNYFPMHSGIPNNGGYTFPQFSPGGILSSHPNTALHAGTQSVPNYTPVCIIIVQLLMHPTRQPVWCCSL